MTTYLAAAQSNGLGHTGAKLRFRRKLRAVGVKTLSAAALVPALSISFITSPVQAQQLGSAFDNGQVLFLQPYQSANGGIQPIPTPPVQPLSHFHGQQAIGPSGAFSGGLAGPGATITLPPTYATNGQPFVPTQGYAIGQAAGYTNNSTNTSAATWAAAVAASPQVQLSANAWQPAPANLVQGLVQSPNQYLPVANVPGVQPVGTVPTAAQLPAESSFTVAGPSYAISAASAASSSGAAIPTSGQPLHSNFGPHGVPIIGQDPVIRNNYQIFAEE